VISFSCSFALLHFSVQISFSSRSSSSDCPFIRDEQFFLLKRIFHCLSNTITVLHMHHLRKYVVKYSKIIS
jgi:hypothetical protein